MEKETAFSNWQKEECERWWMVEGIKGWFSASELCWHVVLSSTVMYENNNTQAEASLPMQQAKGTESR